MSADGRVLKPRLIVLDTAHFSGMVSDALSPDQSRRDAVKHFVGTLGEQGWIPLVSFHHLEELMQHADDALVDSRIAFLRKLPLMAWIRGDPSTDIPGSIVDLKAAEVARAVEQPEAGLLDVRNSVRQTEVRFGSGSDAIPDMADEWRVLREFLRERQVQAQKVAAMAKWRAAEDIDESQMSEWLEGRLLPREEANKVIEVQLDLLTKEIAERGDKRIESPAALASEFMWDVVKEVGATSLVDGRSPALQFLLAAGLEREDIHPNETFEVLSNRLVHYSKLRVVNRQLGLPWSLVKARATAERLPTATIQDAMRRYAQDQPERKGSMLNDVSLLCLAAYADLTFVDKRTLNDVRQASRRVPELGSLLGQVERAGHYSQVLNHVH